MKLDQEGSDRQTDLNVNNCPRCGSEAEIFSLGIYDMEMVKCSLCPITAIHEDYGLDQLIEIWNEL